MTISEKQFARPRIVLSQCLELEACRHDGQRIRDSFVRALMEHVDIVPVCPEVAIGMGVPRDSIRLVAMGDGHTHLVQPATKHDYTREMVQFSKSFLERLGAVDGFVLKSGSPSCGTRDVKVYSGLEKAPMIRREPGMFTREVLEHHEGLAVEDEGRLRNYDIRHHFLTQIFALADWRGFISDPKPSALVDFQRRYKHLLYVYDEPGLRELGKLAANALPRSFDHVVEQYGRRFQKAISRPPRRAAHFNAITHMYGHFKYEISDQERDTFFNLLEEARQHHLPLSALVAVLRSWCARFENSYLADQVYLEPYPRELIQMRDSGKGLEY